MNQRRPEPVKLTLVDLQSKYHMLDFLVNQEAKKITEEIGLSLKAGELVGKIHDRFLEKYHDPMAKHTQRSLNILCVRLVFCLYAEDAGLFGSKDAFSAYISQYEPKDIRSALINLFKVLDTPYEERPDLYLSDELAAFPYCNGGLFQDENIVIPQITDALKEILLESAKFNWAQISPTIFGAVFESTLNPETRRAGGMHYTSIENIHKVIDPLFLDNLKAELAKIKAIAVQNDKIRRLKQFQQKLSGLIFLDPACGSGNFLTETYICLRRLENEVLLDLHKGQIMLANEETSPIQVSISQFYGIEINDFAVTVAKTALWIAESQMMKETEDVVLMPLDFLPLKTNASIVEGNALRLNWNNVVSRTRLTYIIGNPPFVGASMMTSEQKADAVAIFGNINLSNSIDYVGAWYYKAADIMRNTQIHAALVSTNSITQGEQVEPLWRSLFDNNSLTIEFAYRTFRWDSEATAKAHVHCVIIGFTCGLAQTPRVIIDGNSKTLCSNINPYLIPAENVFIASRSTPICNVPKLTKGNQPTDDGNFILSPEEKKAILKTNPEVEDLIKPYIGAKDFLNQNAVRYCLWLKDVNPCRYVNCSEIMRMIQAVKDFRLKSSAAPTRKSADRAFMFFSTPQTDDSFIIIPRHSSEKRRYIPMAIYGNDVIASDSCSIIPGGNLYHFGVLQSNVHMAWMRTVCGRLEMRYRYSGGVVYNNFPWPDATPEQIKEIERTAQGILDARMHYSNCTLAQLYGDNMIVFTDLIEAHRKNDIAVMKAYGMSIRETSESSCIARLMKLYQEIVEK